MSTPPGTNALAEATDVACAQEAAELVRHPGHGARAEARWSDLRAAAERLNAALRPRFVSTVLLLGGVMVTLAAGLSCLAP